MATSAGAARAAQWERVGVRARRQYLAGVLVRRVAGAVAGAHSTDLAGRDAALAPGSPLDDLPQAPGHRAPPWRSPSALVGAGLLLLVALLGVLVPLTTPYAPDQIISGAKLLPPSLAHPFGTDALGRDLLTRVAYGSHLAAKMALLSVGLSLLAGLVLGSLAGYYGGWADQIISRVMDGWLALPGSLVAVVVVARLGPSLDNLIVALGLMGVPAFHRIVRSATIGARRMPYAEAAVALGASDARVMWRHVFPNVLSPVVVLTTLRLGTALLTGSSLSFIGLGAQPPAPEWGALLAAGRSYVNTAWWLAVFPGLAATLTVVGLNLLGDGLHDLLDPQAAGAPGSPAGMGPDTKDGKRKEIRCKEI